MKIIKFDLKYLKKQFEDEFKINISSKYPVSELKNCEVSFCFRDKNEVMVSEKKLSLSNFSGCITEILDGVVYSNLKKSGIVIIPEDLFSANEEAYFENYIELFPCLKLKFNEDYSYFIDSKEAIAFYPSELKPSSLPSFSGKEIYSESNIDKIFFENSSQDLAKSFFEIVDGKTKEIVSSGSFEKGYAYMNLIPNREYEVNSFFIIKNNNTTLKISGEKIKINKPLIRTEDLGLKVKSFEHKKIVIAVPETNYFTKKISIKLHGSSNSVIFVKDISDEIVIEYDSSSFLSGDVINVEVSGIMFNDDYFVSDSSILFTQSIPIPDLELYEDFKVLVDDFTGNIEVLGVSNSSAFEKIYYEIGSEKGEVVSI